MKQLFYLFVVIFTVNSFALPINECKTDIYFGNGVWNKQFSQDNCVNDTDVADCSRIELEKIIQREIIKNDPLLKAKYGKVKLAYNWGQGRMEDLLETFYQLKENGQISEKTFFALVEEFVAKAASDLTDVELEEMREQIVDMISSAEESNIATMLEKYNKESIKSGHRILLVSHSQGNLFANRIYDSIFPKGYQNYFANLQVASPANEVEATKGDHVTLYGDPIISPIPESMAGNANGNPGHAFVGAYLDQEDPCTKIVTKMKQLLEALDSEGSQWGTDQEFKRNTCDYKITVKHRFDDEIIMDEEVYPFAPSKKLYKVGDKWVKATCGGQNILDEWEGKQASECLMIDNPPREKVISDKQMFYDKVVIVVDKAIDYGGVYSPYILFIGIKDGQSKIIAIYKPIQRNQIIDYNAHANMEWVKGQLSYKMVDETIHSGYVLVELNNLQEVREELTKLWHYEYDFVQYQSYNGMSSYIENKFQFQECMINNLVNQFIKPGYVFWIYNDGTVYNYLRYPIKF